MSNGEIIKVGQIEVRSSGTVYTIKIITDKYIEEWMRKREEDIK